jgi:hypothetical protein
LARWAARSIGDRDELPLCNAEVGLIFPIRLGIAPLVTLHCRLGGWNFFDDWYSCSASAELCGATALHFLSGCETQISKR